MATISAGISTTLPSGCCTGTMTGCCAIEGALDTCADGANGGKRSIGCALLLG